MTRRGALQFPVIGVASPRWSLARLRQRVRDAVRQSGGIDDPRALGRLLSSFHYVSGDHEEPGTSTEIRKALAGARRPAHYLAIPPSLFATVIEGLGEQLLSGADLDVDNTLLDNDRVVKDPR